MDQTLGATAHHVRKLAAAGLLEWAGERRVRGALQTFYMPSAAGAEAYERMRAEELVRLGISADALDDVDLDDEARQEVNSVLNGLRDELESIVGRVRMRAIAQADDEPE